MTGREIARAAARRGAPVLLRVGRSARELGPPFGAFERDGGGRVSLLTRYRASVKSTWPANWWAVDGLLRLHRRASLPADAAELAAAIERSRTLPVPVAEVAAALGELRPSFPDELLETGRRDEALGVDVLEVAPRDEDVRATAAAYAALADDVFRTAARHGIGREARVLDAGTGSGYLAFALAGLGAGEVIGVDVEPDLYVLPAERAAVAALLTVGEPERVRLERADVHRLPFPDASFDLVCSMTAVEHFTDLERAVAEMRRVLRPGGVMVHGVEPWFSKRGGHGLCTLDFPWGHVRLRAEELERYLRENRPHEAESALEYCRSGFQQPPMTLRESRAVFARHADVLEWTEVEVPARDVHRALATRDVLADCRRHFPSVERRDLLTLAYRVVARG